MQILNGNLVSDLCFSSASVLTESYYFSGGPENIWNNPSMNSDSTQFRVTEGCLHKKIATGNRKPTLLPLFTKKGAAKIRLVLECDGNALLNSHGKVSIIIMLI